MIKGRPSEVCLYPSKIMLRRYMSGEFLELFLQADPCFISCAEEFLGRILRIDLVAHYGMGLFLPNAPVQRRAAQRTVRCNRLLGCLREAELQCRSGREAKEPPQVAKVRCPGCDEPHAFVQAAGAIIRVDHVQANRVIALLSGEHP